MVYLSAECQEQGAPETMSHVLGCGRHQQSRTTVFDDRDDLRNGTNLMRSQCLVDQHLFDVT
jgi:hypothetical protein